jgi:molecular chaperone GrpE
MDKPHRADDETVAVEAADVASLVAENAALRDRHLRVLADAENERRRSERQAQDARTYAVTQFARELLPIADNLQRAVEAAGAGAEEADRQLNRAANKFGNGDALLEGVKATERMLAAAFERFGVRKVSAKDAAFDPALHEAVMQLDDPLAAPGTVLQVLEDGYTIHDRLLRPARVAVAKRPSPEQPLES